MFFLATLLCAAPLVVLSGTPCPPRENIYPCSCANIPQSKSKVHTVVNCHRLRDSDVLSDIFEALRTMEIDQFHLYDSFWEADTKQDGDSKRVLPAQWWSLLKIREMEIVDTALATCFGCGGKSSCQNKPSHINRFTAVNVSSSDKICSLCDAAAGNAYPWTACMKNLKHFHYSHGQLTTLDKTLFPMAMNELTLLNLTHNKISMIHPEAFTNLVLLSQLDLSHNAIEAVNFITKKTGIKYLDLSWNSIQTLGQLITNAPYLETLNLQYNEIMHLPEADWKGVSKSLRYLDLNENPLHCDCTVRWVNSTFAVHTIVLGTCATPDDYTNSALRTASRKLNQRCDDDGNIGTRSRTKSTTPMTLL